MKYPACSSVTRPKLPFDVEAETAGQSTSQAEHQSEHPSASRSESPSTRQSGMEDVDVGSFDYVAHTEEEEMQIDTDARSETTSVVPSSTPSAASSHEVYIPPRHLQPKKPKKEPPMITQALLNDWIRDMDLTKNNAELHASHVLEITPEDKISEVMFLIN